MEAIYKVLIFLLFSGYFRLAGEIRKIKESMAAFTKHDTNGTSKDVIEENTTIEVNDFVMEIKTQKEFKVTRIVDENKFECIERDGFAIYTFGKDEIRFISKL